MKWYLMVFVIFVLGCNSREYVVEKIETPFYRPNTVFTSFEDISLPKFDSLKTKYQLDTIFHGEQDEFKRILLLRNWIRNKIQINDFGDPYPGNDHPQAIIDAALKGQGYHCGHYMVVQNAVMNAYGYVTRCLGSGAGVKGADGHHGMNEIWLNRLNKWFLSDAKFNHHFEKNGVPLSALEVRDEFLKNKAADVVVVKGPERTSISVDSLRDKHGKYQQKNKEWFAQTYTWLEWEKENSRFTAWPQFRTQLNMYEDEYFSMNTWIWDGKPHWAYNTDQMIKVHNRAAIEWTPNVVQAEAEIKGENATVTLTSFTPNLREYQLRKGAEAEWTRCDSTINLELTKQRHEFGFRSVNIANVAGPETRVFIRTK